MTVPSPNPVPHRDPIAVDDFAHAVAPSVNAAGATYQHGPMGGHEWRWSTDAGVWSLTVGGAIDAGPLVIGPGGNRWHLAEYTLQHADLVVLMLRLANALPLMAEHRPDSPGRLLPLGPVVAVPPGVAVNAGQRYEQPIAGSDLPARGTGAYPLPGRRKPMPYPTVAGLYPPGDLRALSERLDRPTVLGGGGPAEYGSDGVAYEGDRVQPYAGDETYAQYQPAPAPGPPWDAAFNQGPPWEGAFRKGDDQGDAGDQGARDG